MSFFSIIFSYLVNIGKALLGNLAPKISQFLTDFVQDDLGQIALDAVAWVDATLGSVTGADPVAMRDAATAKLKADLVTAGHDLSQFGESILNFFVETALQAYKAGIQPSPQMQQAIADAKTLAHPANATTTAI